MGLKKLNTLANDKNTLVWLGKFGAFLFLDLKFKFFG